MAYLFQKSNLKDWFNGLYISEKDLLIDIDKIQSQEKNIGIEKLWNNHILNRSEILFAKKIKFYGIEKEKFLSLLFLDENEPLNEINHHLDWLDFLTNSYTNFDYLNFQKYKKDYKLLNKLELLNIFTPLILNGLSQFEDRLKIILNKNIFFKNDYINIKNIAFKQLFYLLNELFKKVAVLEINSWREENQLVGNTSEERFQYFCEKLIDPEISLEILLKYPLMSRHAFKIISNWIEINLELFERLISDWNKIKQVFLEQENIQLLDIEYGLGDYHNNGQSVLILKFLNNKKIVYKPRSSIVDKTFQKLLLTLNKFNYKFQFNKTKLISNDKYGWFEYIEHTECSTRQQVEMFYTKLGGYIALLYILEATDFHFENIIASGQEPMLIDLEALFHPRALSKFDETKTVIQYSVLRTGILPIRNNGKTLFEGTDVSGIGGNADLYKSTSYIEDIGKDTMKIQLKKQQISFKNQPKLNGENVDPLLFMNNIIDGFIDIYKIFLENQNLFISQGGPIESFFNAESRVILRNTSIYSSLIEDSNHPIILSDARKYEILLDKLWISSKSEEYLQDIILFEQDSLKKLDIPYFYTYLGSRDLFINNERVKENYFSTSGIDACIDRIKKLSLVDMEKQVWIIKSSLSVLRINNSHKDPNWRINYLPIIGDKFKKADLLDQAINVGDFLEKLSLKNNKGKTWLGLATHSNKWALSPLENDLYNGLSGISLFLCYLSKISSKEKPYLLMEETISNIINTFENKYYLSNLEIGAFTGLSGIVYAFTKIYETYNNQELLQYNKVLISKIYSSLNEQIGLDIISGVSGSILALSHYYNITKDPQTFETILLCGNILIRKIENYFLNNEWQTEFGNTPLTSFSHGMAGYSVALLAIYKLTNNIKFLEYGIKAYKYDKDFYDCTEQDWLDLRYGRESRVFSPSWCAGSAGIGLSKILISKVIGEDSLLDEIRIATKSIIKNGFGQNHSLCHGDFGNLDFLICAQKTLKEDFPELEFKRLQGKIVSSILNEGYLCGTPFNIETPGLMTGISGIGYGLLRLYDSNLPCISSLE